MSSAVVVAVQSKFAALSAGGFPGATVPALYFDEAPQTSGSGSQVQVVTQGYAVLKDRGGTERALAFGTVTLVTQRYDIELYYPSLGDATAAALAIRYNGGSESQRLGFDYGTLPGLSSPWALRAIRPTADRAEKAGLGKDGKPVHQWTMSYEIELVRS